VYYGQASQPISGEVRLNNTDEPGFWPRAYWRLAIVPEIWLQQGSSTALTIERVLRQLTDGGIVIPNASEVRSYLLDHPELIDLVLSVCLRCRKRFGSEDQLSLEVYRDPEMADSYLTLYVRQKHYDSELLNIIADISIGFDSQNTTTGGWFLVTSDFKPPR
jgi:hypothetical protein